MGRGGGVGPVIGGGTCDGVGVGPVMGVGGTCDGKLNDGPYNTRLSLKKRAWWIVPHFSSHLKLGKLAALLVK